MDDAENKRKKENALEITTPIILLQFIDHVVKTFNTTRFASMTVCIEEGKMVVRKNEEKK